MHSAKHILNSIFPAGGILSFFRTFSTRPIDNHFASTAVLPSTATSTAKAAHKANHLAVEVDIIFSGQVLVPTRIGVGPHPTEDEIKVVDVYTQKLSDNYALSIDIGIGKN